MTTLALREGEVLWIQPALMPRAGCPTGFPFRVTYVDHAGRERVWVRGQRLVPSTGEPVEELRSARTPDELASVVRRAGVQGALGSETAGLMERSLTFAGWIMTPRSPSR